MTSSCQCLFCHDCYTSRVFESGRNGFKELLFLLWLPLIRYLFTCKLFCQSSCTVACIQEPNILCTRKYKKKKKHKRLTKHKNCFALNKVNVIAIIIFLIQYYKLYITDNNNKCCLTMD